MSKAIPQPPFPLDEKSASEIHEFYWFMMEKVESRKNFSTDISAQAEWDRHWKKGVMNILLRIALEVEAMQLSAEANDFD